jgi:hypothetical protein
MFRGLESRRPVGHQRRRRWCCQSVFEMIDDITSFLLSHSLVTSKRAYATMASFLFDLEPSICSVLFLCAITYISFSCAYRLKTSNEAFPPFNIFSFRYTATFFFLPSDHVISYHLVFLPFLSFSSLQIARIFSFHWPPCFCVRE